MKTLILILTLFVVSCGSSTEPTKISMPAGDKTDLTRIIKVKGYPLKGDDNYEALTFQNFNAYSILLSDYNIVYEDEALFWILESYNIKPNAIQSSRYGVSFRLEDTTAKISLFKGRLRIQTFVVPKLEAGEVYIVPNE